jgi:hypothetical protein
MTDRKRAARSGFMSRRGVLANIAILLLSLFAALPAAAGGYVFKAEVLDFRAEGNDAYRMVLIANPFGDDLGPTELMIVHLGHDEAVTRKVPKEALSKESYLAAIALLQQQIAQSPIIQLGVMGGGLTPIEDKPGEFGSYSLSIEEGIVYSWNGAID